MIVDRQKEYLIHDAGMLCEQQVHFRELTVVIRRGKGSDVYIDIVFASARNKRQ